MPLVWTALRWLGVVALGWWSSDVYNESQTTQQLSAASVVSATKKSFLSRWWLYLLVLGLLIIVAWVLKKFKFIKK